jgi:hypothetical protein
MKFTKISLLFFQTLYQHCLGNASQKDLSLWDDQEQFYYDVVEMFDGSTERLKVRSPVELIPMFARNYACRSIQRAKGISETN